MNARAALEVLFALLEDYAPMWYTEEHHNLAVDALSMSAENATPDADMQGKVLKIETRSYKDRVGRVGKRAARPAAIP